MSNNGIPYLPTKEVLWYERAVFERMMREIKWPESVLASIMIHDMPSIATTKMLIRKHGPQIALMKICHMIDHYDVEVEIDVL